MKWVFVAIFTGVLLLCIFIGGGAYFLYEEMKGDNADYVVEFIEEHAASNKIAVVMHYNDEEIITINEETALPLASTVKIIVAIAYAKQVAAGTISSTALVPLTQLEPFYIRNTDGGAHEAWLKSLKNRNTVTLQEVAKGMMLYSSNANTEYFMHLLGLDVINDVLDELDLEQHEPLYPFVSALALHQQFDEQTLLQMPLSTYREHAQQIHEQWQQKPLSLTQKDEIVTHLTTDAQKIWSDRLPRATATNYIKLMKWFNEKEYFEPAVYAALDPITEQLMENPHNQQWLLHAGQKGGSTAFVLTMAMYATDKQQNKAEMVLLMNDLSLKEQAKLTRHLNRFQLAFLQEASFRTRLHKLKERKEE